LRSPSALARRAAFVYTLPHPRNAGLRRGGEMTETGLQKVAFFVLIALIFYVAVTGGA
jgi:hypothetical protein